MDSIGKITEDIINRSPFLRESMTEGLINVSALARKIQPEIEELTGKEVKEGAIVMAIKRMSPGLYHKLNVKIQNFLGDLGDVTIRSSLIGCTFQNSDATFQKQAELFRIVVSENDGFFALCKGTVESTFITSEKHLPVINELFSDEKFISTYKDVSSITIKLPRTKGDVQGIYYYLLKQLAWQGVNIHEVISSSKEFTIIVDQDEVNKSFLILNQLKKGYINF